ncbi:hypothetical protein, partial [Candidatus Thiosymbion oneisti]
FQTAYGPHHQLAATLRADALWAAPDNAGQPAGLIVSKQWALGWGEGVKERRSVPFGLWLRGVDLK